MLSHKEKILNVFIAICYSENHIYDCWYLFIIQTTKKRPRFLCDLTETSVCKMHLMKCVKMLIYLAMMKVCYLYSHEERISDYNSEDKR